MHIKQESLITFSKYLLNLKKFIALSLIGISLSAYTMFKVNVLDFHHLFGRCSGSNSYCNVCKNCKYCGHCAKEGGTCAVCYTPSAVVKRSVPVRTYRSERSVSSNNVHAINPGSPAVKRYYLRKASVKSSSSRQRIAIDQAEPEISSSNDSIDSNYKTGTPIISKIESRNDAEMITRTPSVSDEKESFTIEIPKNADFVRVTAVVANLREVNNTKSRILQRLKHGDLLIRLKAIKGWVKVQALDSGEIGYVFGDLLK